MTENDAGNVAAIREAAEKLVKYLPKFLDAIDYYGIDGYYSSCYKKDLKELHGRMDFLKSALAAPPRNCDIGTAEEQYKRFRGVCDSKDARQCSYCDLRGLNGLNCSRDKCLARWEQMPYEAEGVNKC